MKTYVNKINEKAGNWMDKYEGSNCHILDGIEIMKSYIYFLLKIRKLINFFLTKDKKCSIIKLLAA